jgi:hypothetical protein
MACRSTSLGVRKARRQSAHSHRKGRVVSTRTGGGDGQGTRSDAPDAPAGFGAVVAAGWAEGEGVERPLVMTIAGPPAEEDVRWITEECEGVGSDPSGWRDGPGCVRCCSCCCTTTGC